MTTASSTERRNSVDNLRPSSLSFATGKPKRSTHGTKRPEVGPRRPEIESVSKDRTLLDAFKALESLRDDDSCPMVKIELEQLIDGKIRQTVERGCLEISATCNHLETMGELLLCEATSFRDRAVSADRDRKAQTSEKSAILKLVRLVSKTAEVWSEMRTKMASIESKLSSNDQLLTLSSQKLDAILRWTLSQSRSQVTHVTHRCHIKLSTILSRAVAIVCLHFEDVPFETVVTLSCLSEEFNCSLKELNSSVVKVKFFDGVATCQASVAAKRMAVLLMGEARKVASARLRREQRFKDGGSTSDYFSEDGQNTETTPSVLSVDLGSLLEVVTSCNQRLLLKLIFAIQSGQPQRAPRVASGGHQRARWGTPETSVVRDRQETYRRSDAIFWGAFWSQFCNQLEHELVATLDHGCDLSPILHSIRDAVQNGDLTEDAALALQSLNSRLSLVCTMRMWSRLFSEVNSEIRQFSLTDKCLTADKNKTCIGHVTLPALVTKSRLPQFDPQRSAIVLALSDLELIVRSLDKSVLPSDDKEANLAVIESSRGQLIDQLVNELNQLAVEAARLHLPIRAYRSSSFSPQCPDNPWTIELAQIVLKVSLESLELVPRSPSCLSLQHRLVTAVPAAILNVIKADKVKFSKEGVTLFSGHVTKLSLWLTDKFGHAADQCPDLRSLVSFVGSLQSLARRRAFLPDSSVHPLTPLTTSNQGWSANNALNAKAHRVNFLCFYCPLAFWD
ncbi:hypothetical protein HDE_09449 [Halotydeus destructor]|nr:hypothetical protein HDE_09449 [Halotydeus destructor]